MGGTCPCDTPCSDAPAPPTHTAPRARVLTVTGLSLVGIASGAGRGNARYAPAFLCALCPSA
eukprot:366398-Chlamydomonas_euryale.AAC.3